MTALLEQIRPLLAAAEARVQTLREMEQLALALDGAGGGTAPIPEPAAAVRSIEAAGVAPRPVTAGRNSAGVTVSPESSPAARNGADAPGPAIGDPGSGPSGNGHAPRTPHVPAIDARPGRAGVLWALGQLGEGTYSQIAELTKTKPETVGAIIRGLVNDGEVCAVGTGDRAGGTNGRRPGVFALKVRRTETQPLNSTRGRILALVTRQRHVGVTPTEVAEQLRLDRSTVARYLTELHNDDLVDQLDNGTYAATSANREGSQ